jgi:hypothetical protein
MPATDAHAITAVICSPLLGVHHVAVAAFELRRGHVIRSGVSGVTRACARAVFWSSSTATQPPMPQSGCRAMAPAAPGARRQSVGCRARWRKPAPAAAAPRSGRGLWLGRARCRRSAGSGPGRRSGLGQPLRLSGHPPLGLRRLPAPDPGRPGPGPGQHAAGLDVVGELCGPPRRGDFHPGEQGVDTPEDRQARGPAAAVCSSARRTG